MPFPMRLIVLSSLLGLAINAATAASAPAQSIEGAPLRPLSAWEVGVLSAGETPAPPERWRSTSPQQLALALQGLPDVIISPAGWRLALRALTSPAVGDPASPADDGLIEARYGALGRLGAAERLAAMVRASSDARSRTRLALYAAQAELANGSPEEACLRARGPTEPSADLLLFRAFCSALARQAGPTDVAVDLARAAGAKDPFLLSVLPALAGVSTVKPAGSYDSSLHAAASLAVGAKPGAAPLKSASSLALLVAARSDAATPAVRYEAVERSLIRGGLSDATAQAALQAVIESTPPRTKPPWLAGALREVRTLEAAARTAKVAQLFAAETLLSRRSALARLFQAEVLAEPRGGEPPEAIAPLVRAALLLGDTKAAQRWRLRLAADTPAAERAHLDCLLAAALGEGLGDAASARLAAALGDEARAARDVALLAALGTLSAKAQEVAATANKGDRFDEQALAGLVEAAGRGAAGEAALRAAALIAPGAARFDVRGLTSLIQALRDSGFTEDARAVAVEAMLG